jgi:hypothetical protein
VRRTLRTVELSRAFKTTSTAIPRPFGNYGLFLLDAGRITDADRANALRDRCIGMVKELRAQIAAVRERAQGTARQQWDELLGGIPDPEAPDALPAPVELVAGSLLYGLESEETPERLANLDVAARMGEAMERSERAAQDLPAAIARAAAADEAWLAGVRERIAGVLEPLGALWTFHERFRVLAPGAPGFRDGQARASPLAAGPCVARVHCRLGPGVARGAFSAELARIAEQRVNGVVWVDNPAGEPLVLSGRLRGRMVLVVGAGGAQVNDLNAGAPPEDLVTIHCRTGTVRLAGKSRVSVVLAAPDPGEAEPLLEIDAKASTRGSIVVARPADGIAWRGELARDVAQISGFTGPDGKDHSFPENTFVGLSPKILYRRMWRE